MVIYNNWYGRPSCRLWYNFAMLNLHRLLIEPFVEKTINAYEEIFGQMEPAVGDFLKWSGCLALENIAKTDNLYHNIEHTILVALVGQSILRGKHLLDGDIAPKDWLNFMVALLCHDIGYVKGVCRHDSDELMATGIGAERVAISREGTDAALTPYHVDRSQLFVRERFAEQQGDFVAIDVVNRHIEMTRFPIPDDDFYQEKRGFRSLARAADFIGQLGDPNYLRKIPALFYEFEETGANEAIGYKSPGDMRRKFTWFYYGEIRPYIQEALHYLGATQEGQAWIASLNAHVVEIENSWS